ncbi:phospho-N-acetylmuramoyl-pentapeptide-transferase [Frondihabitans cladoniiphilus]|uniref:Phospho-N-acetylmuramoyl-pentapeptide-transferase n=1 Tax=Frondihabitans cladoniiphilus TaxID=715785 RepID=A0ABP8W9N8_9MICO
MIALLVGGAVSLVFTLLLTPWFIKLFHRLGWGQFIRSDGPQSHHTKRGTATMGGIVLILGTVLGYFVGHLAGGDRLTPSGLLVLLMMVGLGFIGFLDDFTKVRNQRSLGLGGWAKILGQVIVAVIFAVLAITVHSRVGQTSASHFISGVRDIPWLNLFFAGSLIGGVLFAIWVIMITVSASNGVNVADGLDGLATGASILAIGSYIVIGFWQNNQLCGSVRAVGSACYTTTNPLDLAVVAACISGGLIGFLWWNTSPAQIFLGDTGSLGLGGAVAALAILTRTELLLVLIGGLFLVVTGSVILQRIYFKLTHGKRIFLMSPLHHHFELKGWAEVTVVVRFWIIAGLFVAAALGVFYLEWISRT